MPGKVEGHGIFVLAGTNGAGKSSVAGSMFRGHGQDYFNPDEATAELRRGNPAMTASQANADAWLQGRNLLEDAIARRRRFAFETTLGGHTITSLLESALDKRIEVRIWYVGLDSPERHIARVQARVAHGGHDIPEEKIRERYSSSILNLCRLAPRLTELLVYDNSFEGDPAEGVRPRPVLVLSAAKGRIVEMMDPGKVPDWAKPIVMALWKRRR